MPKLTFLILLMLTACTGALTNSSDRIAVTCQVDRSTLARSYLHILDSEATRLSVTFRNHEGQVSYPHATPGSCIALPHEAGELAVVDSKNKLSFYYRVTGAEAEGLQIATLVKKPKLSFDSTCQGENEFAHRQLKRNWSLGSDGSISNLKLRVEARPVNAGASTILFEKGFGSEGALPEAWNTADLPEGQYQLDVFLLDLTDGLETAPLAVSFAKTCPLTVIHHAPTILGLADGTVRIPVFETNQPVDWAPSGQNATLHACLEERTESTCQARSRCVSPESFPLQDRISSSVEGLFNIFVYSQDKAGNTSAVECRPVIFSSNAPDFQLAWTQDRMNRVGAVLDETKPILKAQVSGLSHPSIALPDLQEQLSCKVEFILQSTETVSTPKVYCTEGACQNQSLENWTPCSPEIGIAIYDFWSSSYKEHATLRLKVRATDRAGHTREKNRSITLNASLWSNQSIKLDSPDTWRIADSVHEAQDGSILVFVEGDTVNLWKDGVMVDVTPPVDPDTHAQSVQSRDGEVYYFGTRNGDSIAYRWALGGYEHLSQLDGLVSTRALIHPERGLWVAGLDKTIYLVGTSFETHVAMPESFRKETKFTRDLQGRFWATYQDTVYQRDAAGVWNAVPVPLDNPEPTLAYRLWVDQRGGIWAIGSANDTIRSILLLRGETPRAFPELVKELAKNPSMIPEDFNLDDAGNPQVGKYFWSAATESWMTQPLLEKMRDTFSRTYLAPNGQKFWPTLENRVFFQTNNELAMAPRSLGMMQTVFIDSQGTIWSYGWQGVFRHSRKNWIDRKGDLDKINFAQRIWTGSDGNPRMCNSWGSLWELKDSVWILLAETKDLDHSTFSDCFENKAGEVFVQTGLAIWMLKPGEAPKRLISTKSRSLSRIFFEDSQHFTWFSCEEEKVKLCSYKDGRIQSFPVASSTFSSDKTCTFEIEGRLYFPGQVYFDASRTLMLPIEGEIMFPDNRSLRVSSCERVDDHSSLLWTSEGRMLWNGLTFMPMDADLQDVSTNFFKPSFDGGLYLSSLESKTPSTPPVTLKERLNNGSVFRLTGDGKITEIISAKERRASYDAFDQSPTGFLTDANGDVWGLSQHNFDLTSRLIQIFK